MSVDQEEGLHRRACVLIKLDRYHILQLENMETHKISIPLPPHSSHHLPSTSLPIRVNFGDPQRSKKEEVVSGDEPGLRLTRCTDLRSTEEERNHPQSTNHSVLSLNHYRK